MKNSRLPISVVLLTRNEERNVSECLQSCDFAEEIVVVDDDSTDQTVAIAESMGAKVFHRSLNGDWGGGSEDVWNSKGNVSMDLFN